VTDNGMKRLFDLGLAAFLASVGHHLTGIEENGNGRAAFIFRNTSELERDILQYYNRTGSVEPLTFAENLRNFRAAAKNA